MFLTPFPDLLYLEIIAPFLLRIVAGTFFLYLMLRHFQMRRETRGSLSLAVLELLVAVALIAGAYAQIAAIVASLISVAALVKKGRRLFMPLPRSTYILLIAISLSLLVTGAGAFAFDLRL